MPDTTNPVCTITSPTSAATYSTAEATIDIGGTASDDTAVTGVTWANNRGGSGAATGTTSWSKTGIALLPGSNVLTAQASDAAGNHGTDTLTVTCTPVQTPDKAQLGFLIRKDQPKQLRRTLTQSLTIDSIIQASGVTVTKVNSASWLTVPATIDHGTPFDITVVPGSVSGNRYRRYRKTETVRFSKTGYADLDVEVTIDSGIHGAPPPKR